MNLSFVRLLQPAGRFFKVLLLLSLLVIGSTAQAARSGGGFGGRSSGSSSSSRSSGSSSGSSYSRGGGYGGPIIINNGGYGGGYGGGYYGGGYSSGFGLLGLLPLLLFGGVAVFIVYSLVRGLGTRRSLGNAGPQGQNFMADNNSEATQALMVLVIMSEGDDVKRALQAVAQSGDPDSDAGLAQMLQEAALVVLRHPERWAYGNVLLSGGLANQADAQLGAWATQMRAAFDTQTTSNYQNRDLNSGYTHNANFKSEHQAGELYLVVSVGAAVRGLNIPAAPIDSRSVQAALQTIASVSPEQLVRAEVVWSPDTEGEFLSEDEAISKYPQAKKL